MKVAEFLLSNPLLYLLAGNIRGRLELTGRGIFSSSVNRNILIKQTTLRVCPGGGTFQG